MVVHAWWWEGGQTVNANRLFINHQSIPQLAATVDIFPTVMKLAGAELPNVTLDGVDMSPILFSNQEVRNQLRSNHPDTLIVFRVKEILSCSTLLICLKVMVCLLLDGNSTRSISSFKGEHTYSPSKYTTLR